MILYLLHLDQVELMVYPSAGLDNMPWWAGKKEIREYLQKLNAEKKVSRLSIILTVDTHSRIFAALGVYSLSTRPFPRIPGLAVQDGQASVALGHDV